MNQSGDLTVAGVWETPPPAGRTPAHILLIQQLKRDEDSPSARMRRHVALHAFKFKWKIQHL